MTIAIGNKITVRTNGNVEEGYIIGIRPFRGQPPGYTTVWIELDYPAVSSQPDIQVAVRSEDLKNWTLSDLEEWIVRSEANHSKALERSA